MSIKIFSIATLCAGITMWGLAGVWHEVITVSFYTREVAAEHEGIGIIFIAYLILAALMVYLYTIINNGNGRLGEGLKFGAVIGLLWVFPHELAMAGAHGESISYVFKNAAWHVVEQGFGGIVIAFVYGRSNSLNRKSQCS